MFTVYRVDLNDIADEIEQLDLSDLIEQFIYDQEHSNSNSNNSLAALPTFYVKIAIYPSAVAPFHAPSDISGIGGMHSKCIRAVESWRKAHVRLFFSFSHDGVRYPCTLVCWFSRVGNSPNNNTGLWIVEPDISDEDSEILTSVIHHDTIIRAAHLLLVFGHEYVSRTLSSTDTLNEFTSFYVNKYADHHTFKIA